MRGSLPIVYIALAALFLPLAGCGPGSDVRSPVSTSTGADESPGRLANITPSGLTRGGQPAAEADVLLRFYSSDPDTLNVVTSNDTVSGEFQSLVYESLATRQFADPDEWEAVLAESWEFDEETLTFTIRLREGVYWHPIALPNGKQLPRAEFTAADVKFTFDCILNEAIEAAALRSYYTDPAATDASERYKIHVSVIDRRTVKVQWRQPYFLAKEFTLGIPIMPRHVYGMDERGEPISLDFRNSREFADAFNNHWANRTMCGTGPMIFRQWRREQEVVLERNPEYWGEPFYFSRLMYRHIANPNTAVQMLLQNQLDWGGIAEKDQYMQIQRHANVRGGKVHPVAFEFPAYRYMGFNQNRELFKDSRVRWAISHAMPVDEIIEKIYFNLADRLTGPFLPGSPASDDSLEPIPYDLERARQLLDEAGWVDTGTGVRSKVAAGQRIPASFELMIYADSPQYRRIAEIIRDNCRRIGIDVRITPAKWALMLQRLRKKEFDATILGWALGWRGDPFQIWHGSQADLPESSNSIGYRNPEVDRLIEELRVTMDEEKQIELYHQIHRLIYQDQPYTFLFMDKATAAYDSRLENIEFYQIRPCVDVREWTSSRPRMLAQ